MRRAPACDACRPGAILDALPRGADPAIGSGPVALPAQAVTLHVRGPASSVLSRRPVEVSSPGETSADRCLAGVSRSVVPTCSRLCRCTHR